jgi:hypothetical protein
VRIFLTAGTRRNGTSKFGPFSAAPPEIVGYSDAGPFGSGETTLRVLQPAVTDHENDARRAPWPGQDASRPSGRRGSRQVKTARKRVARVVVPAAAVAAAIAAGAAAYGLSGGSPSHAANRNTSLAVHGAVTSTPAAGAGQANGATAAPIGVATATASGAAHAPGHAKATSRHTPAATPPAAQSGGAAHAAPAASAPAKAKQAPAAAVAPAASAPAAAKPAAATLSCNLSSGMLPANVTAIVSFLLDKGYSHNAAAGIAGNIYQESKGDPESVGMGGGGLIGWTPLPSGFVTGNTTADLQTQLSALLTYNQVWAQYLPALNAAASPSAAAGIYVTDFERAGIPAAGTREASAQSVASACGL